MLTIAGIAALLLVAAVAGFSPVRNSDVFWHLASGEWMLQHGRVLDHDPFSVGGTDHWVNIHWLFSLTAAILNKLGGFSILTVFKSVLAVLLMLVFILSLRRHVPIAWLVFCGLSMLVVLSGRIRVRPESFTFIFLMLTIWIVESVRRGGEVRRLWWLVPIMLAWVNMHGLYILGLGVLWSALLGAAIDRRLGRNLEGNLLTRGVLSPILAAHVICLLTPWPFEAAVHPLLLWVRISGEAEFYTYGVSELRPTWSMIWVQPDAIVLVVLAALAMRINYRRVPLGHVGWLAAFIAIGLMARRNVALVGPVCGFLLAWHGAKVFKKIAAWRPKLARIGPVATVLILLFTMGLTVSTVTEWLYRKIGAPIRFGAGLMPDKYPIAMAKFLRDLPADGDIHCLNFGDSGPFMYYAGSKRKVWFDGRLEVHDMDKFIKNHQMSEWLRFVESAELVEIPDAIRFHVVGRSDRDALRAMSLSRRFKLIYIDRAAACFARLDWRGGATGPQDALPEHANLQDLDHPLTPDNTIAHFPPRKRLWYRQSEISLYNQLGGFFMNLGYRDVQKMRMEPEPQRFRLMLMALRYSQATLAEGLISDKIATGTLARTYQQLSRYRNVFACQAAPIDINIARALHLYQLLNPTSDPEMGLYAVAQVTMMLRACHLEAANDVAKAFLDNLPPLQRVRPPRSYLGLVNTTDIKLATARAHLFEIEPEMKGMNPVERARKLSSPDIGLIGQAIRELKGIWQPNAEINFMLGDLTLRCGRPEEARQYYNSAAASDKKLALTIELRLALCDFVEGRLFAAADKLGELVKRDDSPVVRFYLASLLEILGRYDEARAAIANAESDDEQFQKIIEQIRAHLELR